ncbi:probable G-protein coupled receptor 146 [Protopterus annectens]|uniref:probable G-protein coupled receptor 146 n=1 Tax=Protopterus annectens TaxID=7888 RepID=UPI001CFBB81B|nr:probable G-protein coupled receptor 146 [Protopterus annectens]
MWTCAQNPLNVSTAMCDGEQCAPRLVLSIVSVGYAAICLPFGVLFNLLILSVNLHLKSSMQMPDVYFTNMAISGLTINIVVSMQLLSPHLLIWPLWTLNQEICMGGFVLFNIAALVSTYSVTLLCLDYYIEVTVPHTYMSSAHNTKHVCQFVWGGASLASFACFLFLICNKLIEKVQECSRLQAKELGDGIILFTGFVVPAAGMIYAFHLLMTIRKEQPIFPQSSSILDPSSRRLALTVLLVDFVLWLPYYATLLVDVLQASFAFGIQLQNSDLFQLIKRLSELTAYASTLVIPLIYRTQRKNFNSRLKQFFGDMWKSIKYGCRTQSEHQQDDLHTDSIIQT